MPNSTITQLEVLDIINTALRQSKDPRINDVSMENDNQDGEIILTLEDACGKTEWIIRSRNIERLD